MGSNRPHRSLCVIMGRLVFLLVPMCSYVSLCVFIDLYGFLLVLIASYVFLCVLMRPNAS